MPNSVACLALAKGEITEVDTAGAESRIAAGVVVLDVREPDEYDQGALPEAIHIPRGHLESQVEGKLIDKTVPVVVYCAGGVRSAFAARTLHELGYTDVVSMAGGFGRWKDEGRAWKTPVTLNADQRTATAPPAPARGRRRGPGEAARLEGAVARRRAASARRPRSTSPRPASARSASSTWTRSTPPTCSARSCTTSTASATARSTRRRRRSTALNPDVDVVTYDTRLSADNIIDILAGYDVIVDGADNFPSRYLLNDASVKLGIPVVHGSIFRFEGMVSVFDPKRGPTYRDMVPEPPPAELAPAAPRPASWVCCRASSARSRRSRRSSSCSASASRCRADPRYRHARHVVPRLQPAGRSEQPGHVGEPREQIQVRELDGLCAWMDH